MERTEKIRILQRYIDIDKSILELNERYEELFAASTKMTPSYEEGFGGGFEGSKVENACVKLTEIAEKKERLIEKKKMIDDAIRPLQYSQRKLIEYVSIEGHNISQAARYFRRTYINTKTSYYNAIDKMNF